MSHKKETYLFLARKVSSETNIEKKGRLAEALEVCREYLEPDITELYQELGAKD